jgi:hypothetical protein
MTISPSNIKQSKELPLRVESTEDGLYSVKNAYAGQYEYFEGRPLPAIDESVRKPAEEVTPALSRSLG